MGVLQLVGVLSKKDFKKGGTLVKVGCTALGGDRVCQAIGKVLGLDSPARRLLHHVCSGGGLKAPLPCHH